jgi:uncharacterized OB-fold protein
MKTAIVLVALVTVVILIMIRKPRCKHILVPGEDHCCECGERVHFEGRL